MAIDSFEDLLRQLHAHPEWQEQLRSVVLTDRLLALPDLIAELTEAQGRTQGQLEALTQRVEALTERVEALTERVEALTERVEALATAQERTEVRLQGLVEQVSIVAGRADRAIGYLVEQQYRSKAHAYFQTIARRIRVLSGEELDDLLEAAVEAGSVTELEAQHVRWADVVMRARRNDEPVFLVVEASAVVDVGDVERAEHRAGVVSRLGAPAIGIAAGEKILPEAAVAAADRGVWLVTDGHVEAPQPPDRLRSV